MLKDLGPVVQRRQVFVLQLVLQLDTSRNKIHLYLRLLDIQIQHRSVLTMSFCIKYFLCILIVTGYEGLASFLCHLNR